MTLVLPAATMRSFALTIASLLLSSTALAGPVEVLDGLSIAPGKPELLVLRYKNAGGGMFVSDDGGQSFRLLCNSGVDPTLTRDVQSLFVGGDGAIYLGVFDGLWRGAAGGCGFHRVAELDGQWVTDFAPDPLDVGRAYLITSAGGKDNGVYADEGAGFQLTGQKAPLLISRLQVVPIEGGKRMYQSAVRVSELERADGGIDYQSSYLIRRSDDEGQTWIEHEFPEADAATTNLRLLAVDPTDAERIVVGLLRLSGDDELLYSDAAGSPGSFRAIGKVGELGGASFAPDGRLFYGDRDQSTAALYRVQKLGDTPVKLASGYKAGCVTFDAQSDTLYLCQDRVLGTANQSTGELTALFDLTKAEEFVQCEGEPSVRDRCARQLAYGDGYCNYTHYPDTPLCADYGLVGPPGTGRTDGGQEAGTGSVEADAGEGAGAAAKGGSKSDSGCTSVGAGASRGGSATALFGLVLACVLRRLRRRR